MTVKTHIQRVYDATIRPHLPRRTKLVNGVATPRGRLLDLSIVDNDYEAALVDAHRKHTRPDDHVIIVGGGWGVTTVVAARHADSVTVYEPSTRHATIVKDVAVRNGVGPSVDVRHGAVEAPHRVPGGQIYGQRVSAADLPECDVLELDCEGAERSVLGRMTVRPRLLLVEVHPWAWPVDEAREWLADNGYNVSGVAKEATSPRGEPIKVVTALREGADE